MKKIITVFLTILLAFALVPSVLLAEEITAPACDHKYVFSSIKEAPTHLTEGILIYQCSICQSTEERKIAPIEEHEFGYFTTYSKTQHRRICECGAAEYEDHTYGEWKIDKHPTEEATGLEKRTCTVCGAVDTYVIPILTPEATTVTTVETTTETTTVETTTAETTTAELTTVETTTETTTAETTAAETTSYNEPIEEPYSTLVWICIAIAAGIIACVIAAIAIVVIIKKKKK